MKKRILSLLLIFLAVSSIFSMSIQADGFLGSSSGFEVGVVFGNGSFKSTVGCLIDFRDDVVRRLFHHGSRFGFGLFYKFSFDTNFFKLGSIGIGIDTGVFASLGAAASGFAFEIGVIPAVKVSFKSIDVLAGWRGTVFMEYVSRFENSFILGVRFKSSFMNQNSQQSSHQTPGYDFYPIIKKIE